MQITARRANTRAVETLTAHGAHPLLARLYAARGVRHAQELDERLSALLPPDALLGADAAARLLADAIAAQTRILIVADYDCDGATACAIALRALRAMGAQHLDYIVPDRQRHGYGLSPAIVELAAARQPGLLITVDNGIASFEGIAQARSRGIATLITDHHLPADTLPEADVIVNPNQPGCPFPSKALAGCGVIFYVMLALRAELRRRGHFRQQTEPNLADLLDLVALGTVADVVPLDHNNRILVAQGLKRIRAGRMQPGLRALFAIAGRAPERASTFDLGFAAGPRLNAAGRLDDMRLGIECLLTDDAAAALNLARALDQHNRARRDIEQAMQERAEARLQDFDPGKSLAISLFEADWHQGVIGIVAGRLRERYHRPALAFARAEGGLIKGSGRSIAGLHMRDALDLVAKRHPDLILTFGGHAMAAGLTLREADHARFSRIWQETCAELLPAEALQARIETDGSLEDGWRSLDTAYLLDAQVWGQNFPAPRFADRFTIARQRLLKERHLKLQLIATGETQPLDAICFNHAQTMPEQVDVVYRLDANEYNGQTRLQLMVEHLQAAE